MARATPRVENLLELALLSAALKIKQEKGPEAEVWFTEDPVRLHTAMRTLRDHYAEALPALRELTFSPEGSFPHSPELRQALGNLQLDGVIGRRNPSFDRFTPLIFNDSSEVLREQVHELFAGNAKARNAFERLVEDLIRSLAVEPR